MSDTLAADLNLPIKTKRIKETVQVLLLSVHHHFIVLNLFDESQVHGQSASDYALEIAQMLTSSLLRFCHEEFVLLPCSQGIAFDDKNLQTEEQQTTFAKALEDQIQLNVKRLEGFYDGPMRVNKDKYDRLKKAVSLAANVTSVPYLLEDEDAKKVNKLSV